MADQRPNRFIGVDRHAVRVQPTRWLCVGCGRVAVLAGDPDDCQDCGGRSFMKS
ncbi:MAG: hypothetical protein ACM3ZV_07480 [Bacillota bacterium]